MTAIIVVDDQTSNRLIIAKLAATVDENVEVKAFGNPLQALKYAEAHTPDLLITDFKMKPIEGDEFIRRFRKVRSCADVPAVVITSYQDVEYRERALVAGSTDFLLSPIDHNEFRSRSRGLLARRNQQKLAAAGNRAIEEDGLPVERQVLAELQIDMLNDMLLTINAHLAATVTELEFLRNDLSILEKVSHVAAIFVDAGLHIRSFSAAAAELYDLRPSDIGRCLTEIPANLIYPTLDADFAHVRETGELIEKYLHTANGISHYTVRISPYRNARGSIDGAALTFSKVGVWYSGRG